MGCCGGNASDRTGAGVTGTDRYAPWSLASAAEGVMVRYIGDRSGLRTWRGPSGQQYRFGASNPSQRVKAEDADFFAQQQEFQIIEV